MSKAYVVADVPYRRSSGGWAVALMVLIVSAGLLVAGSQVLAVMRSEVGSGSGPGSGLRLDLVDGSGRAMTGPDITVADPLPGTTAQVGRVTVTNTSPLSASYSLSSSDLQTSGDASLDDILVVTVTDTSTSTVLYNGRLSGLALEGAALEPADSRSYGISIAYPGTANDTRYVGAWLSFSLRADQHPGGD